MHAYTMFCGVIASVVLVLFFSSCSSTPSTHRFGEEMLPPSHSIVFIIHGDGNYLYHDTHGNRYRANEETLEGAKKVAKQNTKAEVFIFHQKPKRRLFGLFFRLNDGDFYYYRNGRLLASESYRRDHGRTRLYPEAELYHRFRAGELSETMNVLLYFGHEIPEFGGKGYDASFRNEAFTVDDFAGGLKRITQDSAYFDLIVLSTCSNGTPYTVSAIAPYTDYIIASPGDLHLSYFDIRPFESLDAVLHDGDVFEFAKHYAHQTFERLTKDVLTSVTIAVYDVDRVQQFINSVNNVYENTLRKIKGENPLSLKRFDCTENPAYAIPEGSEGVYVLHRPSQFGRSQYIENHSGWTCWRLAE